VVSIERLAYTQSSDAASIFTASPSVIVNVIVKNDAPTGALLTACPPVFLVRVDVWQKRLLP
jgi:hypothetical protein